MTALAGAVIPTCSPPPAGPNSWFGPTVLALSGANTTSRPHTGKAVQQDFSCPGNGIRKIPLVLRVIAPSYPVHTHAAPRATPSGGRGFAGGAPQDASGTARRRWR
ncbi:hypothetical protein Pta02_33210 [Planobispora takensis]|uniref:Uncharacterized protein n=1 Tax=Planobispora takensis TaxID=1367882 RepID=A0A8J3WUA7_9ACTN|nr:hypothetical protein Pta02_33210 [Planobispora takensis]